MNKETAVHAAGVIPSAPRRRDTIFFRIFLSIGVLVLTLGAILTFGNALRSQRINADNLKKQGDYLLSVLAATVADYMYFGDIAKLSDILEKFGEEGGYVTHIRAYDPEGVILSDGIDESAGYVVSKDPLGVTIVTAAESFEMWEPDYLLVCTPVTIGRRTVGGLSLGLPLDSMKRQARAAYIYSVVMMGLVLGAALIAGFLIARRVSGPIRALMSTANAIERGDIDAPIRIDGRDEIGALAAAFASMVSALKNSLEDLSRSRDDLRRSKEEVEARVAQRTSELAHANERLREAIAEANEANKAKSEFLATMSHELRTPLNHIIGFTDLVMDQRSGPLNETQSSYLRDSLDSSKHLLALINNVLDLAKIEAGKVDLEIAECDLRDLLEAGVAMVRAKADEYDIEVSSDVSAAPTSMLLDATKIRQILDNVVSNAMKFTPAKGSVHVAFQNHDDENYSVTVADSGIGLKEEDVHRVFESFEQVRDGQFRSLQGTGLGLPLARQYVELHGGRIWAESPGPGQGTTITFTLPKKTRTPDNGSSDKSAVRSAQ